MTDVASSFVPIGVGELTLPNRIAMAPMTRSRADAAGVVTETTAEYYAQRASAGLIITEGIQPSPIGQGYPSTPGLHNDEQIIAWRKVTDAVHAAGGRIFAQLMHAGRISHPATLPTGLRPVGPSPIAARGEIHTADGVKPYVTPRALTGVEVEQTIADFTEAARNAVAAGFDGVELHGGNGYLIHQFLAPMVNMRTDEWGRGGDRCFATETAAAVADAIGAGRTAIRLSPGLSNNDMYEVSPLPTYEPLVQRLSRLGLAYVHVFEGGDRNLTHALRQAYDGVFVLCPNTGERPTGLEDLTLIEDGTTDILGFGRQFLANPDLPRRLAEGGPFNSILPSSFYGSGAEGYTDYPALPA